MKELGTFVYWVQEREAIRMRKEIDHVDPPYTGDPILAAYRFCNVRREDDRVTRWIADNIREPFADHPHLWFMLCAARMINWPRTLSMVIGDTEEQPHDRIYMNTWPDSPSFNPAAMGDALEDISSMGAKVFTGAYVIPAPTVKGETKGRYVAEKVLGDLWRDRGKFEGHFNGRRTRCPPTLRSTHAFLMTYRSWGPFMAYQAVVDMRFTALLSGAADVDSWCAAGPGTIRGLNRLHGRPVKGPLSQGDALKELLELHPILIRKAGVGMDLSDVPNVCCEVDKYIRVRDGEGQPRALYVPGRGS